MTWQSAAQMAQSINGISRKNLILFKVGTIFFAAMHKARTKRKKGLFPLASIIAQMEIT